MTKMNPHQPIGDSFDQVEDWLRKNAKQFERFCPTGCTLSEYLIDLCLELRAFDDPEIGFPTFESFIDTLRRGRVANMRFGPPTDFCHIVPFRDKKRGVMTAQYVPGASGWLELGRRAGAFVDHFAGTVYQGDEWHFRDGIDPEYQHTPQYECDYSDDSNIVLFYSHFQLPPYEQGGPVRNRVFVKTLAEMKKHRDDWPKAKHPNSPWQKAFPQMCIKTVLAEPFKRRVLPISAHVEIDEMHYAKPLEIERAETPAIENKTIDAPTWTHPTTGDTVGVDRQADRVREQVREELNKSPRQAFDPDTGLPTDGPPSERSKRQEPSDEEKAEILEQEAKGK